MKRKINMNESNVHKSVLDEKKNIKLDNDHDMEKSEKDKLSGISGLPDRRAIVVDDDPMILKLLTRVLTLMKIEVQAFIDPCDALKMFEKEPVPLVLTDLDMPGMDGIELLIKMKDICPSSKIIIITGYGDEAQEQRAFDHGVAEFMAKPLEMAALKSLVTSLLDGSPK
jgi:DNA-binding NtrC family response regulator